MSEPGIGAMLHALGGGSDKSAADYYGRKVKQAKIEDNALYLTFEDGIRIKLSDEGQSCCESRYITCDDNVKDLVGHTLTAIEIKKHENKDVEGDVHEICFIEVRTTGSAIIICTHNEHNGYYGGFGLNICEV